MRKTFTIKDFRKTNTKKPPFIVCKDYTILFSLILLFLDLKNFKIYPYLMKLTLRNVF